MACSNNEIWRPVPEFTNLYEVSTLGRVRRSPTWRNTRGSPSKPGLLLSLREERNGYIRVRLSRDGLKHTFLVNRLVALAFLPISDPDNLEVNHIDGNRANNILSNLEWLTSKDNQAHSFLSGKRRGRGTVKLMPADVRRIRTLRARGMTVTAIARKYNMDNSQISRIVNRLAWACVK